MPNKLGIPAANNFVPVTPGSSMPAGTIISYSGSIASFTSTAMADSTTLIHKDGWAVCNGASVPKATYSQLFARVDTTWNASANPLTGSNQSAPADSANNFRIPNLQGVFLRSVADYSGADAYDTANDVVLGVYKADKFQDHKHVSIAASGLNNLANAGAAGLFAFDSGNSTISGQATQTSTGYGAPRIGTETAPKQVGVYYLIKLYDNLAAVDVYIPAASATTTGLISREYTYSGSALALTYPGGGRNGNSFASASMHILRVGTGYYINILGSMNIAAAGSRTTYIVSNTGFSWPAGTPSMVGILAGGSMQNTSGQGFPVHCYIETSSSLMRATFDWIYPAGSAANETTSVGCSFFIPVV
jgi:hypothetical protein